MTRPMYDGVTPDSVPAGAAIYAGYDDGDWQSYSALAAAHLGALHVSICVTAAGSARVLDVESGDATPEQAPGWAAAQRKGGNPYPVVYMNMTTWPAVKAAFAAQHVDPPLYWVALYVTDPANVPGIPDGAIAIQYYDYGGYDVSAAADYWPGLDPAPVTATTAKTTQLEEDEDTVSTSVNGRAGLSWASGARHVLQISGDPGVIRGATFRAVVNVKQPEGAGPYEVATGWTLPSTGAGSIEIPTQYIADSCAAYVYCSNPAVPFELIAV